MKYWYQDYLVSHNGELRKGNNYRPCSESVYAGVDFRKTDPDRTNWMSLDWPEIMGYSHLRLSMWLRWEDRL